MTRFAAASTVFALALTVGLAAEMKQYGKPLTLKEVTKVSDIYANPDKYKDKRVQIEGPVVDVCAEMGCWIAVGSENPSQTLRFKVDDGVIVLPMSARGHHAKVEGVISVTTQSEAEQIKEGEEMAKDMKMTFDPKTVKGPKVAIMIKGEGAEVTDAK
jgi:hypothetical protein